MMHINQSDTHVRITVEHGLISTGESKSLYFYWDCKDQMFAELMAKQLRERFESRITTIRQEEYNRGWKDAKAKKAKANWFPSVLRKFYNI